MHLRGERRALLLASFVSGTVTRRVLKWKEGQGDACLENRLAWEEYKCIKKVSIQHCVFFVAKEVRNQKETGPLPTLSFPDFWLLDFTMSASISR